MYYETKGDGSCGYKVVWQATQQALVPIIEDRVDAPVDIRYKDDTDRLARIRRSSGKLDAPSKPSKVTYLHPVVKDV